MFERFKKAGEILFASGCNDSHSGNMSVRDGDGIMITSRLSMPSRLNKEDILAVRIDAGGPEDDLASRDLEFHRLIYKNSKNQAVIHAHLPNVLALCVTENKILPQDTKGQYFFPQGITILKPRQISDKDEIARLMSSSLSSSPFVAVIKGYGVFVAAGSLEEALEIMTCLEQSSKIWLASKLVGVKQTQPTHSSQPSNNNRYDHNRKRSAIPPGIGVMGRRTGGYNRRGI